MQVEDVADSDEEPEQRCILHSITIFQLVYLGFSKIRISTCFWQQGMVFTSNTNWDFSQNLIITGILVSLDLDLNTVMYTQYAAHYC